MEAGWDGTEFDALVEAFIGSTDRSVPKVRRKLGIVEQATTLFIQRGYKKTSVDEIARRSGISKGAVYLHFENKAEILLSAIAMEEKTHLARLGPILAHAPDATERLRLWLAQALQLAADMPLSCRLLGGDLEILAAMRDLPPDLIKRSEEISHGFARRLVSEAVPPGTLSAQELEDRARVINSMVYFSALVARDEVRGGLSEERFSSLMAEMIVKGIGGQLSQG